MPSTRRRLGAARASVGRLRAPLHRVPPCADGPAAAPLAPTAHPSHAPITTTPTKLMPRHLAWHARLCQGARLRCAARAAAAGRSRRAHRSVTCANASSGSGGPMTASATPAAAPMPPAAATAQQPARLQVMFTMTCARGGGRRRGACAGTRAGLLGCAGCVPCIVRGASTSAKPRAEHASWGNDRAAARRTFKAACDCTDGLQTRLCKSSCMRAGVPFARQPARAKSWGCAPTARSAVPRAAARAPAARTAARCRRPLARQPARSASPGRCQAAATRRRRLRRRRPCRPARSAPRVARGLAKVRLAGTETVSLLHRSVRMSVVGACSPSLHAHRACQQHGRTALPADRNRGSAKCAWVTCCGHRCMLAKILRTWGAPRRRLRAASPASRPAAPAAHGWLPPAPHASGQAPGAPSAPRSPGTQRPMRWRSLAGQAKLANSSTARQRCRPQSALRAAARLRRRRSERALA